MTYSDARRRALRAVTDRQPRRLDLYRRGERRLSIEEVFGANTFGPVVQERFLSEPVRRRLCSIIRGEAELDEDTANSVAHGMKEWAQEKGATHFCHWFQPLTGATAEKHDAFLSFTGDGEPISRFRGSQLVQGEPDASSFPSGGMRATFEARGYTGWDPSSPAFLLEGPAGLTLCIPSVFCSYHGEVLDKKTPLLRAMAAMDREGRALLELFGKSPDRVDVTIGCEQEYFLIDRALVALRPDLTIAHRTLMGRQPPKGQQLEDQYFGSVPDRAIAFMQELDYELYRLGIPAKTRHNEVAPNQFEIAPVFEEANVAADHNQLLMATMTRVARRHGFEALLHEKPFAGINGSGKHLNWSLSTAEGENLLDPGDTPHENLQFLVVLASVLQAVHRRAGLLRATVANSGNDFRLGANEAPPAILSVFLGSQLSRLVDSIVAGRGLEWEDHSLIDLGIGHLPALTRDSTDRNRTSPFAFTGNKFEFRALGSSASVSTPTAFLTAAVAEAVHEAVAAICERMEAGESLHEATIEVLRASLEGSSPVRFEGDNYAGDWVAEAEVRGLPHHRLAPEALAQLGAEESKEFLDRWGLLSPTEAEAVRHVELDRYVKQVSIEAALMVELGRTQVLAAAAAYAGSLARDLRALQQTGVGSADGVARVLTAVSAGVDRLERALTELERRLEGIDEEDLPAAAAALSHLRDAEMLAVREASDSLEGLVADCYWPLPRYRELLFSV